ncbi:hypothetical protein PIB30_074380 [Stylosanthes scabra]|uniref:Uncharacterized protein n=1 Tax=Stylosanthes scabra TaxID=79078 RepID=A0ABU6UPL9_9FABA|nr:hypothetical protein [Stylosanthes scabra]
MYRDDLPARLQDSIMDGTLDSGLGGCVVGSMMGEKQRGFDKATKRATDERRLGVGGTSVVSPHLSQFTTSSLSPPNSDVSQSHYHAVAIFCSLSHHPFG